MVTGVGDSPQGHDQPEPPASPDLEQAVPVQPQCRWWSSKRQWPPLAEEGYIDFKYQALHMPHFLSSLAALGLVGIYAVLFAEDVTLHGTIFPALYWWRLSLSAGGGLLSVAACLLFRHAPRRARRFAVPLHLLMGLYWSFVLSLDPHRMVAMAYPRSTYNAELAKVRVRVRVRFRVRVRVGVRVRARARVRISVRVSVRVGFGYPNPNPNLNLNPNPNPNPNPNQVVAAARSRAALVPERVRRLRHRGRAELLHQLVRARPPPLDPLVHVRLRLLPTHAAWRLPAPG